MKHRLGCRNILYTMGIVYLTISILTSCFAITISAPS